MGRVGIHPAAFVRVASKGLTGYGTGKSAQRTENKGFANAPFARNCEQRSKTVTEQSGSAGLVGDFHDLYYQTSTVSVKVIMKPVSARAGLRRSTGDFTSAVSPP